jgi:ABC-2 type transport system ATP-binding protein
MIRAQNLSKYYGGKRALGPVSFEIEDGETVGFLGLNGAGKTTALRIFACDLRPSSGSVKVGNFDAVERPHEVRKRIGFLPETPPVYQDMLVDDYLAFAGKLRGMSKGEVDKRIPEVVDLTHLKDVRYELISSLSHGYRQRVGVGQAIMHKPDLLILDEPTRGLDPVQIVEMRNMIRDLTGEHTVLISSHILTEISQTCDRLLVLGKGKIIASGTEEDLSANLLEINRVAVTIKPRKGEDEDGYRDAKDVEQKLHKLLMGIDGATKVTMTGLEDNAFEFEIDCDKDIRPDAARIAVEAGHDVLRLDRAQRELESIFLRLVQGDAEAPAASLAPPKVADDDDDSEPESEPDEADEEDKEDDDESN